MEEKIWTKKELIEGLKNNIANNGKVALHALEVIYGFQTESEKEDKETQVDNGKGFNHLDANFMTGLYDNWKRYGSLSQKQLFMYKNA